MSRLRKDRLLLAAVTGCAWQTGAITLFIFYFLGRESFPVLASVDPLKFLNDSTWYPTDGQYNLMPMFVGTLFVSMGAILVALPLAVCSGLFLHFYAPIGLSRVYRGLVQLLAGIPSVIFGFWGLVSLVPLINLWEPPGSSLLAGILVLALMTLPTMTVIIDTGFEASKKTYMGSAVALGLGRWSLIRGLILPTTKRRMGSAVLLGLMRAVGETMAILMVCGNIIQVPDSLFSPVRSLTANIAMEMPFATGIHRSGLFFSGLLLIAIILFFMSITRIFQPEGRG